MISLDCEILEKEIRSCISLVPQYLIQFIFFKKKKERNKTLSWIEKQKEKGTTEDEMVGWHHQLNRHEFEPALWDSEGQRNLVCCSPLRCKESDTNWKRQQFCLFWTVNSWNYIICSHLCLVFVTQCYIYEIHPFHHLYDCVWIYKHFVTVAPLLSCVQVFGIPWTCSMPGFPVLHYLLEFAQNSCSLSQWCHPTTSSSVIPFSSCLQSFPASRSFSNIYIYIMLLIGILVVSCYELQCHELLYIGVLVYTWGHFCWVHRQVARIAGL